MTESYIEKIPEHLTPFIAHQDPSLYTSIDHASWRYIMRVSKDFFQKHAHEKYLDGLEATGITTESIPLISEMDDKLKKFGWRAVGVVGFIPPSIFLEFQSLGILPIACDMRTLDHIAYTPAPDIVHEAAGHAPILVDPAYGTYLKKYGEAARNAIFSKDDMEVYEAIRNLSDIKEEPNSTQEDIDQAQLRLDNAVASVHYVSEATALARIAWWTIEYGLIGDTQKPLIYGAGLLSSIGESFDSLTKNAASFVPLTVDCTQMSYDITKPQPQLYVTPSFEHLNQVLNEFIDTMAYQKGGLSGLAKAKTAETVTTSVYDSGLQVSGVLKDFQMDSKGEVSYLQFTGPCQLSMEDKQLPGHGPDYHLEGFGSPVGRVKNLNKSPAELTNEDLSKMGFIDKKMGKLEFESGVLVEGIFLRKLEENGKCLILTFKDCTVRMGDQVLFEPAWGNFDLACGAEIISVFGGPADRAIYMRNTGSLKAVSTTPKTNLTAKNKVLVNLYEEVRKIREEENLSNENKARLETVAKTLRDQWPEDWLLRLELIELDARFKLNTQWAKDIRYQLDLISKSNSHHGELIRRGLNLLA